MVHSSITMLFGRFIWFQSVWAVLLALWTIGWVDFENQAIQKFNSAGSIVHGKRWKFYSGTFALTGANNLRKQIEKNANFLAYYRYLLQIWCINLPFSGRNRMARKKLRRIRPIHSYLFQESLAQLPKISKNIRKIAIFCIFVQLWKSSWL